MSEMNDTIQQSGAAKSSAISSTSGANFDFKFNEHGLIPAIVQDAKSGRVLMMAWMNRESILKTAETGLMHYWSRSRKKLWLKGETSGHTQKVVRWFKDCDADTLLFEVEQTSGACHTGYESCFFQPLNRDGSPTEITEQKVFDPSETYRNESGKKESRK